MGRRPKAEIVDPEPEPEPARTRRRRSTTTPASEPSLSEVLTEAKVLRYADARSWRLGEEYLAAGAVIGLSSDDKKITATVQGTLPYAVRLGLTRRSNISYQCSCPYHEDEGVFCKHCVAVALAYLRSLSAEEIDVPAGSPMDRIRVYLETQSQEQLTTLLMAQALENESLRRHLLWLAGPDSAPRPRLVFRPIQ